MPCFTDRPTRCTPARCSTSIVLTTVSYLTLRSAEITTGVLALPAWSTATLRHADLAARVTEVQAGNANTPVVISADRNVKYETVVKAMDVLQRAGVQRVGLSVKQGTP